MVSSSIFDGLQTDVLCISKGPVLNVQAITCRDHRKGVVDNLAQWVQFRVSIDTALIQALLGFLQKNSLLFPEQNLRNSTRLKLETLGDSMSHTDTERTPKSRTTCKLQFFY